ncbi:DMT family transporter [Bacteroides propionicifaciens]|jgi:bacterial/archaeal transporter family protein|uniref:DMT family transporter n=1 Tax=Bacteroides propionicifaciens TaxID=392838 RepID=UPI00035C30A3|nr:DMT family transporter [Bacteroides propionicifaciens]
MWLLLAFFSALFLGLYDVSRKVSLQGNSVLPVLFLNTVFCSLIFLPFLLVSTFFPDTLSGTIFYVPPIDWKSHGLIFIKSTIVLTSWCFGYYGIKNLPLTLVGPINATRPVMILVGAMLIYGERLNLYQWIGVILAITSIFLLSRSGKKEGINFVKNRWIIYVAIASLAGATSGLYDRYLLRIVEPMAVQSWFNLYQILIMGTILLIIWYPRRRQNTPFQWRWSILMISVFLSIADFAYFYALSYSDSMISIVSMVRRGSVLVSFLFGAFVLHESNLKNKLVDLSLILIGMIFLYLGTK